MLTSVRPGFMSKRHRPAVVVRGDAKGLAGAVGTTRGAGAGGSWVASRGPDWPRRCFTAAARQARTEPPADSHEHERESCWRRDRRPFVGVDQPRRVATDDRVVVAH